MKKWMSLVVLVLSSVAASGCGGDTVPPVGFVNYATHVQPILTARCVRCHGAGGTLNGDPDVVNDGSSELLKTVVILKGRPTLGHFDCGSEDRGTCPGMGCKRGFRFFAIGQPGEGAANMWLAHMPPPPSPPLTDREWDILANWRAQPDISTCMTP
jgi:hypothetical protein